LLSEVAKPLLSLEHVALTSALIIARPVATEPVIFTSEAATGFDVLAVVEELPPPQEATKILKQMDESKSNNLFFLI
jgi:hypothetical protein